MNEVLEYLFFTRTLADEFADCLRERGLVWREQIEPVQEAWVLAIDEGISDALWDELDTLYDGYALRDQQLLEQGMEDEAAHSTAGIYLQLAGGRQTIAQVDPELMNRILSVLSMDELNAFLDVVVRSVEQPDDSAICQRPGP
ncbi:MAG: hypothetical protein KDI15_11400 [Thiothrix sp.]|nr:hypothetical protein [Thiothrix sp.]